MANPSEYKVPEKLKNATKGFKKKADLDLKRAQRDDAKEDIGLRLEELRLNDFGWRVNSRGRVTHLAYLLLFIQNALVPCIVWYAIHTNKSLPAGYYQMMIVLIGATLTESAYVIRLIVKWLFTEINYMEGTQRKSKVDQGP